MLRHPSPPTFLLRLLSAIPRSHPANPAPEKGLTLIECLVAIVIISITVVAITPPIFVATASRIQSRRAEQANAIAQAEIDRIRAIVERGSSYTTAQLPASGGAGDATAIAAATGVNTALLASPGICPGNKYPATAAIATQVIPVDVDGDCKPEFAMQVFRSNDCTPASLQAVVPPVAPYAFTAGVRVYGYEAGPPNNPMSNLSKERALLGLTTGRGGDNSAAGAQRQPLQVLYTKVARVGDEQALECAQ
ncbi:MAG: hypothetical protein DCF22_06765 [Leptolyngbya sp.]|nr:MAG: hypothetical protein DCF22_06765 [Leptolyngbya sp.]